MSGEVFVRDRIKKNPELCALCLDMHDHAARYAIDSGKPSEINYRTLFLQEFGGATHPLVSGLVMLNFHHFLLHKQAALHAIELPGKPHRDRLKIENNQVLSQIPQPFKAQFAGGAGENDGLLEWNINDPLSPQDEISKRSHGSYSLEVGTCSIWRLWHHTVHGGGWVRWCYGSRFLYLFILGEEARQGLVTADSLQTNETAEQLSLFNLSNF